MRFLIDANMPRSAAELLKRYNHEAVDVRDIGMGAAADSDIAIYAQQNGLAAVTRGFDFADIRNYPPSQYAGLLVLALPEDAVATFVVRVLESFLANKELIEALPGHLAIVEPARVRLRPPEDRIRDRSKMDEMGSSSSQPTSKSDSAKALDRDMSIIFRSLGYLTRPRLILAAMAVEPLLHA